MLDFAKIIHLIGQQAYLLQQREVTLDSKALKAVASRDEASRSELLIAWLNRYSVLMGLPGPTRCLVAQTALEWCDRQASTTSLVTVNEVVIAHGELTSACRAAVDGKRRFTSLASKVLWLRYPHDVPIFDRNAQYALWLLSKCETALPPLPPNGKNYAQFATVWRYFYDRYREAIESIDAGSYPYRVRIFDKILWIMGAKCYTVSEAVS